MAKTQFLHDFNTVLARFTSNNFRLGTFIIQAIMDQVVYFMTWATITQSFHFLIGDLFVIFSRKSFLCIEEQYFKS